MEIRVQVENQEKQHRVVVSTNGLEQALEIAPKVNGRGSSVNGGELLALSIATCYCNDLYREAAARGIVVRSVSVQVDAQFGGAGEPAHSIRYRTWISADAPQQAVQELAEHTDRVAEVHNTLRLGIPVLLDQIRIVD